MDDSVLDFELVQLLQSSLGLSFIGKTDYRLSLGNVFAVLNDLDVARLQSLVMQHLSQLLLVHFIMKILHEELLAVEIVALAVASLVLSSHQLRGVLQISRAVPRVGLSEVPILVVD